MSRKIYVGGPMTGLPRHNADAFVSAEVWLREAGWQVFNPATTPFTTLANAGYEVLHEDCMRYDFQTLLRVDAVAFLPGWQRSKGATAEWVVASTLSLELYEIVPRTGEDIFTSRPLLVPLREGRFSPALHLKFAGDDRVG